MLFFFADAVAAPPLRKPPGVVLALAALTLNNFPLLALTLEEVGVLPAGDPNIPAPPLL